MKQTTKSRPQFSYIIKFTLFNKLNCNVYGTTPGK